MRLENIEKGDYVVYIPKHLLLGDKDKMVEDKNLGIVSSKNDTYVFVVYPLNGSNSQATRPEDLFTLRNRPELIEKLDLLRPKVRGLTNKIKTDYGEN